MSAPAVYPSWTLTPPLKSTSDLILWKLDALAMLGYVAFALDMFGTGRALWNRAESLAARKPITEDRSKMQVRDRLKRTRLASAT